MRPVENKIGSPLETTSRPTVRNQDVDEPGPAYDTREVDPCSELLENTELASQVHEATERLAHWFALPPGQRGLNPKAIGCRVIMAMWVMRPDIIGNLSLTEISALVDARPEVLSRQATAFSKRFGIRGRAQFSEKTRKAQREAATRRAQKKGGANGLQ